MATCLQCIEDAKLRNRDYIGMEQKARTIAQYEQKPQAICWEIKGGLYITDAASAIRDRAHIRNTISIL